MVLSSASARSISENPDQVLRSPSRWLFVAAGVFVFAVGALFALAGALAPLGASEERQWLPVLVGVQLTAFGGALVALLWPPRQNRAPLPRPIAVPDGVALPLRRAPHIAGAVGLLVIASLGVTVAVAADGVGMKVLGVVMVVVGAVFAIMVVRGASRGRGAIVLTPDSVTIPAGTTPRTTIAWADLAEVAVTGGWQPHLVATYKGPGLATSRLSAQAWRPRVLLETLEFYRTHRDARAHLTSPSALEPFLDKP